MKVRSDAWSHEEDLLLAETVLRHIREGSTQLTAFEEVGDELNRTSAACGFRWNAEIRKHYEPAISLAKKQRKEFKRAQATEHALYRSDSLIEEHHNIDTPPILHTEVKTIDTQESPPSTLSMKAVITFLQQWEEQNTVSHQHLHTHLLAENRNLKETLSHLEDKFERLYRQYQLIQEDYKAILSIMNRARKIVTTEEVNHELAPIFKLDENGNLDIV